MIENLKHINDLNIKLAKFTEKDLDDLYLRVFNSADGELLLQDMANRFHVHAPCVDQFDEGQRSVLVSIMTRLQCSVAPKAEESNG